jgi:hypothetical protein
MFRIFVAECRRRQKKTLPSSLMVRPITKVQFATKCINLNVKFILAGFIFFKLIIGLTYEGLGNFFCLRRKFGTCRTLNQKEKYYN